MGKRDQHLPDAGPSADPGHPQPRDAEAESARTLEMETAEELEAAGFDRELIRRLADEFVARDEQGGSRAFVSWANRRMASQVWRGSTEGKT
jgi:hypothetical protein